MTHAEVTNLLATAKKQCNIINYAKGIKKAIEERQSIHDEMDTTDDNDKWLALYDEMRNKERAIVMKIRHFYEMQYGKGNIFNTNNKGRGYLEYLWAFQDSARIYGIKF